MIKNVRACVRERESESGGYQRVWGSVRVHTFV